VRLLLTAHGIDTGLDLFHLEVEGNGCWRYQSHMVDKAEGRLTEGDLAQLLSLFAKVEWDKQYVDGGVNHVLDRVEFVLWVEHDDGERQHFIFSDTYRGLTWEMRDLVHFLRHNVATGGEPVGPNQPFLPTETAAPEQPRL
jgi:hypothetical protein